MKNLNNYKRRFNILMESTMGNVKPLINENENEVDNFLSTINVDEYCSGNGTPKWVTNILNKLPEDMRVKAKEFIKAFGNTISKENFKLKDLLNLRKEIKSKIQNAKSQNLNEQLAEIVIAGIAISPSLLIAIGAVILFIIIVVMITRSGKGGGGGRRRGRSCNPGWWNNL